MQDEIRSAFKELLNDHCAPAVVRAIDSGASSDELWNQLANSGFLDALVPENQDGAGLALSDVLPLVQLCGYHAVPIPFAETMAARSILAREGHNWPTTPLQLKKLDSKLSSEQLLTIRAALLVALISGAADRVLELTLAHATSRVQFGKPIGSFQAVQHQLSIMAEQVCAVRIASQMCFASDTHLPDLTRTAMAMVIAGEAAILVSTIAHAVHGAIGVCEEMDLQLYTRRLLAWRTEAGSPAYWSGKVGEQWWNSDKNNLAVDFALDSLRSAVTT